MRCFVFLQRKISSNSEKNKTRNLKNRRFFKFSPHCYNLRFTICVFMVKFCTNFELIFCEKEKGLRKE